MTRGMASMCSPGAVVSVPSTGTCRWYSEGELLRRGPLLADGLFEGSDRTAVVVVVNIETSLSIQRSLSFRSTARVQACARHHDRRQTAHQRIGQLEAVSAQSR